MDPGTVLGVVSLGLQVCNGLLGYLKDWKACPKEVQDVCQSLQGTEKTLNLIQNIGKRLPDEPAAVRIEVSLRRCRGIFEELQQELKELNKNHDHDSNSTERIRFKVKSQWLRANYPRKKGTIQNLLKLLHEQEDNLVLLLEILQIDAISILDQKVDDLSRAVVEGQTFEKNKKLSQILEWLCSVNPSVNHEAANSKRQVGTGNWLLESRQFCEWKTSGSLMWLNGEIGRGKTVLCSAVIEDLRSLCATDTSCRLAYFYFSFRDQQKGLPITCLSSILRQLCTSTEVPKGLEALYESCNKDFRPAPRLDELKTWLHSLIEKIGKVYIILDALDECQKYTDGLQRAQMIKWILGIPTATRSNVHLLCTSRSDSGASDIAKVIRSHPSHIEVPVAAISTAEDIRLYLAEQFESNQILQDMNTVATVDIPDLLLKKAGGMFQWVSCQIDILKSLQAFQQTSIDEVLSSLPETLDGVYDRILDSIHSKSLSTAVANALQWLSHSLQPMTVEEIDEASIIKPDAPVAVIDRDRMNPHGLLTLLQGLVNTRLVKEVVTWGDHTLDLEDFFTGRITRHEEEHTELWLSHFSVQEFLTSGRARDEKFKFQKEASHAFISRNCIAYIFYYSSSSQKTVTALDLKLFPLLYYACRFWFEHARLAGASGKVLTSLIINLLQSSTVWEDCLIVCNPQGSRNKNPFSSKVIRRLASPLGWAAVLGLDLVVEELLKNYDRNIDEYQDEAESEFLKRKILAGSSGMDLFDFDGTALMKAAAFGHDKVVRLLIENGAAVNFCPEQSGDTALNVACYQDKEDCVRLLLDNGANINGQQGDNDTALHTVARLDNVKIGQILLELGADPNGPPESDVSPLMNAAWHGSLNMCKLLIENNADINRHSEDPDYPDALAAAASTGDLEVVEFLLSKHAVITDGALYYSLTGAEQEPPERQEVICRLFVEHGANLNPVDETYEIYDRPLALALYNGWNDISKLMIAKGAKIDPDDQSCLNSGNILQAAVLGGSTELVKLLLDKRIDANAPTADVQLYKYWGIEERFATPLQAAAYTLDVDITQILLARNADANSFGPPFGSPLGALAASGRLFYETKITEILEKTEAIYQLLILNNANLESAITLCKDDRCRWVLGALRKGILRKKLFKYHAERVSAAQQKRGEESHV